MGLGTQDAWLAFFDLGGDYYQSLVLMLECFLPLSLSAAKSLGAGVDS